MKNIFGYARFAFYVLALPLLATAAVSAHQYLLDNTPIRAQIAVPAEQLVSALVGSFRNHTLTVDEIGTVQGRVSIVNQDMSTTGLKSLRVCLVRDGMVVHVSNTSSMGQFEFTGVEEGVYSFVTSGKDGFATFGVKVARGNTPNKIEVAVVNPDFREVRKIFESVVPSTDKSRIVVTDIPAIIDGNNVVSVSGGTLVGKLSNLVNGEVSLDTKAYLVRDNQRLAESTVDEYGQFSFSDVKPGIYEFVAVGPTGYAAFTFEVVDGESAVGLWSGPAGNSSENAVTAASQLDVGITGSGDGSVVNEQLGDAADAGGSGEPSVEPYAGELVGEDITSGAAAGSMGYTEGFYGGGAGGGYGGAGGAGGLIGLGRLAVLGWVLTELFNNVDWDDNEPPPVSPST